MKLLLSIATLGALAWIAFLFLPGKPPATAGPGPGENPEAPVRSAPGIGSDGPADLSAQTVAQPVRVLEIAGEADRLHTPGSAPEEDGLILQNMLGEFRRHHGGNPIGGNEDIVGALRGRNSMGLAYFPAAHPQLDEDGRLLDRWGSPYFFHALSGEEMHIRSAGPDRTLFTPDDLLHKGY